MRLKVCITSSENCVKFWDPTKELDLFYLDSFFLSWRLWLILCEKLFEFSSFMSNKNIVKL